jgi:hypothetical protein
LPAPDNAVPHRDQGTGVQRIVPRLGRKADPANAAYTTDSADATNAANATDTANATDASDTANPANAPNPTLGLQFTHHNNSLV